LVVYLNAKTAEPNGPRLLDYGNYAVLFLAAKIIGNYEPEIVNAELF